MARYKKKLEDDIRCPLEYGLAVFGGKWKSRIICVLSANERLRYSEIRKEMYNITDAVLTLNLKDLITDGIVDRKAYDEIPRVEYSLTERRDILLYRFCKVFVNGQIFSIKMIAKIQCRNVKNAIIIDKENLKMLRYTEDKIFSEDQVQQLFLSVNWISGKYRKKDYIRHL